MGRIRTKSVKRVAEKLLETSKDAFSKDFAENKKNISELVDIKTKKLRNMIAGYVTKKVKTS